MADPIRLLDDPEATPMARTLLQAGLDDGPSAASRARVARGLGIATVAVASTAAPSAAAAIAAAWWKWPLIALAIVGTGTTAYVATRGGDRGAPQVAIPAPEAAPVAPIAPAIAIAPPPPKAATPSTPAIAPAPRATHPAAAPPPRLARPAVAIATPPAPPPALPPPALPPAIVPPAVAPAPTAVADDVALSGDAPIDARQLAAEVALLDRARAQLRAGDTIAALATLDEHHRTFGSGALVPAAAIVRIEVHLQRGDTALAAQLAREFLARFPGSPLAARARAALERASAPRR